MKSLNEYLIEIERRFKIETYRYPFIQKSIWTVKEKGHGVIEYIEYLI